MFPYVFSASKERIEGHVASSFTHFHVGTEQGVDPCLIARPFGLEPIYNLSIQTDGDSGLGFRESEHGALEERFRLLRDIGGVDFFILEHVNSCPVRPRPLSGSAFLHVCSPFLLRRCGSSLIYVR
jgi:hypothetical protein